MNQQMKNRYVAVTQQINSVRKLYSGIGQPLPADIIIDLHHHLGKALALAQPVASGKRKKDKHLKNNIM